MNEEDAFLLFISSGREDAEQVTRLAADLAAQGFSCWTGQEGGHPGPSEGEGALRRAIRASCALLLVASPHSRSARPVKAALRIAQMYTRPVYPVWVQGETWPEVLPADWEGTPGIDARGERYPHALQALVKELRSLQTSSCARPETAPPLAAPTPHPRNPYKGLRPFESKDAGDFFGREECTDTSAHALREVLQAAQSDAPRFFAVVGPHGSGTSSAVRAGLLPHLEQGRLPGSDRWIYLEPMTPGQHPLDALTSVLCEHFPERSLPSLREELEDSRGLHRLAALLRERRDAQSLESIAGFRRSSPASLPQQDPKVLLFVDQFEELYTQTPAEEERQHFLDLLITAMTEPRGPVIVLLALRADCYDRPLGSLALGRLMAAHHRAVLPMTLQELRASIEEPAHLPDVQLRFEDNLVGDLLFDVQGLTEALPLLQFTLAQLVERQNGGCLTHQAYEEIGGVRGALAAQAESTYLSLPSAEHQRWARALFLRLIDPGRDAGAARWSRVPLSDLMLLDSGGTAVLEMTWKTFTEKHVLATSTSMGTPTLEVGHEALLGAWGRLTTWLQEAREDTSLSGPPGKDAVSWRQQGKPTRQLYNGEHLAQAQRWRTSTLPSRDGDAFLQAGVQQHHGAQRGTTRRAVIASVAVLLGFTAGAFSLRRLLSPGAAAPVQTRPSVQALPYTYTGQRGPVLSVAWSPDGTRIASAGVDQTVQVWAAGDGRLLQTYTGHISTVLSVAWSPDGTRIASGSQDQTVRVWEVQSGRLLQTYTGHTSTVWSVAWSPDSTRIASASFDQTVQVWAAGDGKRLQTYRGQRGIIEDVEWSPDGTRIASGSTRAVQVWEVQSGRLLQTYTGHRGTVNSVTWSPDGTRIASASIRTAQVWEVQSGRLLQTYNGHRGFVVYCVAWSPDGTRIASASFDQTVQVWAADGH